MDFSISLAMTVAHLAARGVNMSFHKSRSSCFVEVSRNQLLAEFLKTDCTHALFIDDDMGWEPEAVLAMLERDKEFIAAIGPMKVDSGDQYACQVLTHPDETPIVKEGLIAAARVGAAFILLKRSVVETMIEAYPERRSYVIDAEFGYRFFQAEHSANLFMTEDYYFCDLWRKAGGEIWIYPNMEFIHTGTKDYKGNYFKFMTGDKTEKAVVEPDTHEYGHSIILVTYKAQEEVEKCLQSLAENPPSRKSEIIIIDNSPEPLALEPMIHALTARYGNVTLVNDIGNPGFAEGCNIGARMAKGKNLVFLNPDTIVYQGWADLMANQLVKGVGAVGPVSNFVASHQNIAYYKNVAEDVDWAAFAHDLATGGMHVSIETKLLIGFCLMVPRTVWDTVGEFDKELILGCDDLDYSLRLKKAGLKLKIAADVFVFHKGHASFESESASLEMNKQSEAVMRKKLRKEYGDKVPTSSELWGCDIFETVTTEDIYHAVEKAIKESEAKDFEVEPYQPSDELFPATAISAGNSEGIEKAIQSVQEKGTL